MVLRRGAHEGGPADVDLLDELVITDARPGRGLLEPIEVDDDELEGLDVLRDELRSMR